jgi:hypothetical protein
MLVRASRGVGQQLKYQVLATLAQVLELPITVKTAEKRDQLPIGL